MKKDIGIALLITGIVLVNILVVNAQTLTNSFSSSSSYRDANPQYYAPSISSLYTQDQINTYWPILSNQDATQCYGRQDFIVQVAPAGCQPTVVRSDLLEQQNVPVFCQLDAVKLNPLIDVKSINRIIPSISGKYPSEIAGLGYYPAQAALNSYNTLLGSPVINDIGYAIVVLKRNPVESNMSDFVTANLTAVLQYDLGNAWGVGRGEYYLPVLTDAEWQQRYQEFEFWRGKGFLRLDSLTGNQAVISVYSDATTKVASRTLSIGSSSTSSPVSVSSTSDDIYLPGFYCMASMKLQLNSVDSPADSAILQVNDGQMEVRKGSTFGKSCSVSNINILGGGTGSIDIVCGSEKKTLSMDYAGVSLQVDRNNGTAPQNFAVGDKITTLTRTPINSKSTVTNNLYLAYVGILPQSVSSDKKQFVVLVEATAGDTTYSDSKRDSIRKTLDDKVKSFGTGSGKSLDDFKKAVSDIKVNGYTAYVIAEGENSNFAGAGDSNNDRTISFTGSTISDLTYKGLGTSDSALAGEKIDAYFSKAVSDYEDISTKFPSEKTVNINGADEFYGERALWQAASLADLLGKKNTEQKLWQELVAKYPNSALRYGNDGADANLNKLATLKSSASDFSFAEGDYVRLISFKQVSASEASINVRYTSPGSNTRDVKTLMKGDYIVKRDADTKNYKADSRNYYQDYISLSDMKENYAVINYDCVDQTVTNGKTSFTNKKGSANVNLNDNLNICGYSIYVDTINLKQVAHVSILPNIKNTQSQANFTVKIGIEKRAIQLSTDKTQEMISNLNDSIKRWEDINTNLGNVVEGLKGACFATSAILQVKTLAEGFSGKSTARTMVMGGANGWTAKCTADTAAGKYASVDDCLHKNSAEIDKSVSYLADKINEQNNNIKAIESAPGVSKSDTLGGGTSVDTAASRKGYIQSMQGISVPTVLTDSSGNNPINGQDIWNKAKSNPDILSSLTYDDLKNIDMYSEIANDPNAPSQMQSVAKSNLYSTFQKVNSNVKSIDPTGLGTKLGVSVENYGTSPARIYGGEKAGDLKGLTLPAGSNGNAVSADTPVQVFTYNNQNYIATLGYLGNGQYKVNDFYTVDSSVTTATIISAADRSSRNLPGSTVSGTGANSGAGGGQQSLDSLFSNFVKIDASSYKGNKWKNPRVQYWETDPYKGMPALVPVEPENGWYAATQQTLPSLGNVKTFESSGRVTSFWLCNVGANGIDEFNSGMGDDICEQINMNTGQPTTLFPGLAASEASRLISKAQKAIMDAASKYSAGVQRVSVLGTMYSVAAPASGKLGTQCQDFMSPDDCYTLFNVCDPVICPTSRCNLGGTYYVSDVVQSGIVGSIALCLPNIKEGIFIPVCLTGIHAGIESYLSILKAHRDCLQTSLTTGQHVGICDEIYSIYLCEFFWRQLAPILNMIIPKIIEMGYGQGTRGGGEYLTVMDAWNNMQKSIDYFTTSYAANAVKSFQIRNTEDAGTTVCQAFISTKYPSDINTLLAPESPSQFSAWFSEIPYSDATVPATSQYKVYYHIYSGEDQGVYYSVYLKNPPSTSFYTNIGTVNVATGYISKGQYADQTKDFTAPQGYQQLCVRINSQESCGFKQVSSDFAVNYVQDNYIAQQSSTAVTSEKECVSGSPSLYPLLQPNIQEGVSQSVMPSLYSNGITRICATDDPGRTTEPGRWKDVGYCDNQKVRCWIDTKDVAANIRAKDLQNATLAQIDALNANSSLVKGLSDTPQATQNNITNQKNNLDNFAKNFDTSHWNSNSLAYMDSYLSSAEADLNIAIERAVFNGDKVQLMLIKAQLFENATRILYSRYQSSYTSAVANSVNTASPSSSNSGVSPPSSIQIATNSGVTIDLRTDAGIQLHKFVNNKWYVSNLARGVSSSSVDNAVFTEDSDFNVKLALNSYQNGINYLVSIYNDALTREIKDSSLRILKDGSYYDSLYPQYGFVNSKRADAAVFWTGVQNAGGNSGANTPANSPSTPSAPASTSTTPDWKTAITTKWSDSQLKQDVPILLTVPHTLTFSPTEEIIYRYNSGKWATSDSGLSGKTGYVDGIIYIVDRMSPGVLGISADSVTIKGNTYPKSISNSQDVAEGILNNLDNSPL